MDVFILDLDGTLMPSHVVDNRCYWQAVSEVFQCPDSERDLEGFENITDSGILEEWALSELGRTPTLEEIAAVRHCFLAQLEKAAAQSSEDFRPFDGVNAFFQRHCGTTPIAIATGGWGHTARFKLEQAGLGEFALPLACSDDSATRTGIMAIALERLGLSRKAGTTICYFGDGPWDLRASRDLGWRFVGIARGRRARRLAAAGAGEIHADFTTIA